jgi:transcriptional regulator with XRE-family HTH domain
MKSDKPSLGRLLRGLRMRKEWTLKEMSERTGIPLSTLAKVEHDRLTLTYGKLQQVSQRLKIRMSELFAEPERGYRGDCAAKYRERRKWRMAGWCASSYQLLAFDVNY